MCVAQAPSGRHVTSESTPTAEGEKRAVRAVGDHHVSAETDRTDAEARTHLKVSRLPRSQTDSTEKEKGLPSVSVGMRIFPVFGETG